MMKVILKIILTIIMSTQISNAQKYPLKEDVATINGIIKATYEAVSGEAGEKRQ